jgi:hypothetical protein
MAEQGWKTTRALTLASDEKWNHNIVKERRF